MINQVQQFWCLPATVWKYAVMSMKRDILTNVLVKLKMLTWWRRQKKTPSLGFILWRPWISESIVGIFQWPINRHFHPLSLAASMAEIIGQWRQESLSLWAVWSVAEVFLFPLLHVTFLQCENLSVVSIPSLLVFSLQEHDGLNQVIQRDKYSGIRL